MKQMSTAKAWTALVFLLLTTLLTSPLIPMTGTWHIVVGILTALLGAFGTWYAKYLPDGYIATPITHGADETQPYKNSNY